MAMESPVKSMLFITPFKGDYSRNVRALLDAADLPGALAAAREEGTTRVLIKPNLVGTHRPPVTTPVDLIGAIAAYVIERAPAMRVAVGDGTGNLEYDTDRCFEELGYTALAEKSPIELVDLNHLPSVRLANPAHERWPELFMPGLVMESFVISVPVLKAHTLAEVTLSMKNMIGVAPPAHYQRGGHWKKSSFHERMHESVFDLNRYRTPDFTLLDATRGMKEAHLWGPEMNPAPGLLVAGYDPVAADACGADLLGKDPGRVGHIRMADGVLGSIEPTSIERVGA